MPYPISCSFELDPQTADPRRVLDCFEAAAREVRLEVVSRGSDRLVLSGSLLKGLGVERHLPMSTASRCELTVSGPEGARKVRVRVRFAELVAVGAAVPAITWLLTLVRMRGRGMLLPTAILAACVPLLWLILYLYGMLEARVWTRRRLESLI